MTAPSVNANYLAIYDGDTTPVAVSLDGAVTADTMQPFRNGAQIRDASGSAAGVVNGGRILFPASVDISSYKYFTFQYCSENGTEFNRTEHSVVLYDGAGNWSKYIFHATADIYNSDYFNRGDLRTTADHMTCAIALDATPDASSGVLDLTDFVGVELHMLRSATNAHGGINVGSWSAVTDRVLTAGDEAEPGTFLAFREGIKTDDSWHFNEMYGYSVLLAGSDGDAYIPYVDLTVGDGGTTATRFEDSNFSLPFFPAGNAGQPSNVLRMGALPRLLTFDLGASDYVRVRFGTISGRGDGEWAFRVLGSSSVNCEFEGIPCIRARYYELEQGVYTDFVMDAPQRVSVSPGVVMSPGSVRNSPVDSDGLYLSGAGGDYSALAIVFAASNAGVDVTINPDVGAADFVLTGLSVAAGKTLNIHNASATVDVVVQLNPLVSTVSVTTAGGSVDVQNSVVRTLTRTGIPEGAEVSIYDLNSADYQELGDELANTEGLSGGVFNYVYSSAKAGDSVMLQIILAGYEEFLQPITLPNSDSTDVVNLELETGF